MSVRVNAVVYFRVADPTKAVVEIEEGLEATGDLLFAADGHGFGKGRAS